jgi:thiol-disulfide isomerase/thioredoxin
MKWLSALMKAIYDHYLDYNSMKSKGFGIGISVTVVIMGLGIAWFMLSIRPASDPTTVSSPPYDTLPDFSFVDYNGNTVTNRSIAGTVTIINSWASWCPFCVRELPDFAALQSEFGDTITVIAINRQESSEKAKAYTDSHGLTERMIFLLDPKDTFYTNIGGFAMPETIFVDVNGYIRAHKRGFMTREEMREKTLHILNQ